MIPPCLTTILVTSRCEVNFALSQGGCFGSFKSCGNALNMESTLKGVCEAVTRRNWNLEYEIFGRTTQTSRQLSEGLSQLHSIQITSTCNVSWFQNMANLRYPATKIIFELVNVDNPIPKDNSGLVSTHLVDWSSYSGFTPLKPSGKLRVCELENGFPMVHVSIFLLNRHFWSANHPPPAGVPSRRHPHDSTGWGDRPVGRRWPECPDLRQVACDRRRGFPRIHGYVFFGEHRHRKPLWWWLMMMVHDDD